LPEVAAAPLNKSPASRKKNGASTAKKIKVK
jgi:hypothetical protein